MSVTDEIIRKIPRPNYSELPQLYESLDNMARRIGNILENSKLFERETGIVRFDRASEADIRELIMEDPKVMVPFFTTICGFSERELERLYNIKDVYSLRSTIDERKLNTFVSIIVEHLRHPLSLETLLYKFYKNWEEHQKRHYRGRTAESYVVDFLRSRGFNVGKVKIRCEGKEREIDCAIPPSPREPKVIILIRGGVLRDLAKRAKEYSAEFDELLTCFPQARFVVVYLVSPHERARINEIRMKIEGERRGKRPYDLVILTPEELEILLMKLGEWSIKSEEVKTQS